MEAANIINALAAEIGEWAIAKGFWDDERKLVDLLDRHPTISTEEKTDLRLRIANLVTSTKQMLVVTEGAELVEGLRAATDTDQHCGEFTNAEVECADQVIRLLDLAYNRGWRIGEAIVAKMAANEKRPHQHNKSF